MNKQILLIDDDEDEQTIFTEAIHAADILVDCIYANSAEQGIKLLDKILPDFIFLDFNMPGINGIQCLKKIKEKLSFKEVPVILYSTGADENLTSTAMKSGAAACVKKELSIQAFADTLKRILLPNLSMNINTVY